MKLRTHTATRIASHSVWGALAALAILFAPRLAHATTITCGGMVVTCTAPPNCGCTAAPPCASCNANPCDGGTPQNGSAEFEVGPGDNGTEPMGVYTNGNGNSCNGDYFCVQNGFISGEWFQVQPEVDSNNQWQTILYDWGSSGFDAWMTCVPGLNAEMSIQITKFVQDAGTNSGVKVLMPNGQAPLESNSWTVIVGETYNWAGGGTPCHAKIDNGTSGTSNPYLDVDCSGSSVGATFWALTVSYPNYTFTKGSEVAASTSGAQSLGTGVTVCGLTDIQSPEPFVGVDSSGNGYISAIPSGYGSAKGQCLTIHPPF